MSGYTLYLGNKAYSSWSLRSWLVLKQTGAIFEEVVVPLRQADTRKRILAVSPSGRMPALAHGDFLVWDTIAIAEYLAEQHSSAGLWPGEPPARAIARAVCAEMHAGFQALRQHMPMDLQRRLPDRGREPGVTSDIERISGLWRDCRSRFGAGGPYLFGALSIADAFYAPVVTRFVTYEVALDENAQAYVEAIMDLPAMKEWTEAALAEPRTIELT